MSGPVKKRRICAMPNTAVFLPENKGGGCVAIGADEYEVIRLIDLHGYTQKQCALQMGIARTTVTAIHASAHKKLADAIVFGKGIEVCGGEVYVCEHAENCCKLCAKGGCDTCTKTECYRYLHHLY